MQYSWQYAHPDTWKALEAEPIAWQEGLCSASLAAAGYVPSVELGTSPLVENTPGHGMLWYARDDTAPYPYLAMIDLPGEHIMTVVFATAPDLLSFLARYTSISTDVIGELRM